MSNDPKKFYLTTPIYYVNARPHIGHAYTTIVADVLARRHRLLGDDTFFLTGTDEHGQKIERSAAAAGIPPQLFADKISTEFENLWKRMGITNDAYIRTTGPRHIQGAQKLFSDLYARGQIYLSSYTGQYSIGEEMFVDGPPGTLGPDGRPTETVTEENFFFRLSDYQLPLLNLIESNQLLITPDFARNEVLSFLRGNVVAFVDMTKDPIEEKISDVLFGEIFNAEEGEHPTRAQVEQGAIDRGEIKRSAGGNWFVPGALRNLSISRSSFTWGVPVPEPAASAAMQKHVIYVWLDALSNYMTALGYGSDDETLFKKFWPADLHLVGKEITRFHCVYWPAFLLAAGLPLPKQITAHGWLLFDNSKMSKSKGNIVRTETILDAFGDYVYGKQFPDSIKTERDLFASDVLRYFLLREIPFGQDGSFSFDALITRYNADLANGYGNLVSRTLSMIGQYFTDKESIEKWASIPALDTFDVVSFSRQLSHASDFAMSVIDLQREFTIDFDRYLREVAWLISRADSYISKTSPWNIAKHDDSNSRHNLVAVLYTAAESIRIITALLYPILPYATARVWSQLGLGDIEQAAHNGELTNLQWGALKPGTKLGPLAPIFPRADKGLAQIMIDMENDRTSAPLSTENGEQTTPTTDPAAGPRTASLDEPNGTSTATLPVGGSNALTTGPHPTPSHTEAQASGIFATQPSTGAAGDLALLPAQITIDDFAKIELRVAQILVAERIPKADKLLRLEVDLGPSMPKRQILSGIAEWYAPEDLVGRRIVVITNLAPRKMRGLESHGMLLAASADEDGKPGKPILATMAEDIALGSRLK